jgi:hypothetical protein
MDSGRSHIRILMGLAAVAGAFGADYVDAAGADTYASIYTFDLPAEYLLIGAVEALGF